MITKTFTPRQGTNSEFFRYNLNISDTDGFDQSSGYTCKIKHSNLGNAGEPKLITFGNNGRSDFMTLELSARCNNALLVVEFTPIVQTSVEKAKFEFLKWLASYVTWFDFIFKLVPVAKLKKMVKLLFIAIMSMLVAGIIYSTVEHSYEYITDDDFEDLWVIQVYNSMTAKNLASYIRGDGWDMAIDLKDFVKEKGVEIIEDTGDKLEDLKENIGDKIEDIKD